MKVAKLIKNGFFGSEIEIMSLFRKLIATLESGKVVISIKNIKYTANSKKTVERSNVIAPVLFIDNNFCPFFTGLHFHEFCAILNEAQIYLYIINTYIAITF